MIFFWLKIIGVLVLALAFWKIIYDCKPKKLYTKADLEDKWERINRIVKEKR